MRSKFIIDPVLIVVIVSAGMMRLWSTGILPTWIDELNIIYTAIQLAQNGQMTWTGNESSFGLLSAHSPFTTYVTALPALLYPHPMFLRLFFGIIGIGTVTLAYLMMRHYAGRFAATVTGLLIAVMALPVYWSRFVWNPNVAHIFLIGYLYTGIAGYVERRMSMQWLHWLCLGFAIQSQSALLVLVPLSGGLALIDLWRTKSSYLQTIKRHSAILLLILVTLLPWIIGNIGVAEGWWGTSPSAGDYDDGQIALEIPSRTELVNTTGMLIASATYQRGTLASSDNPADWWFPSGLHTLLFIQTILTVIGAITLVAWHFRIKHEKRYVSLFLTVAAFWSFGLLFANRTVSDFYMMLTPFAIACLLGWILQYLYQWRSWLIVVPVVVIGLQAWLSLSILSYYHRDGKVLSYSEITTYVDAWTESGTEDTLVLQTDTQMSRLEQQEWERHWLIFSETYPIRYTTDNRAIPLSSNGTTIVTELASEWITNWGESTQQYENHKRTFQSMTVTPAAFPDSTHVPAGYHRFGDLARVIGLHAPEAPQPNQTWYAFLYWQPLQTIDRTLQYSIRLVDEDGTRFAQSDQPALNPILWREGDVVVNLVTIPVGDTIPDHPEIDLVMYAYPEGDVIPLQAEDGAQIEMPLRLRTE